MLLMQSEFNESVVFSCFEQIADICIGGILIIITAKFLFSIFKLLTEKLHKTIRVIAAKDKHFFI